VPYPWVIITKTSLDPLIHQYMHIYTTLANYRLHIYRFVRQIPRKPIINARQCIINKYISYIQYINQNTQKNQAPKPVNAQISKLWAIYPFGLDLSWLVCNILKRTLINSVPTYRGSIPRRIAEESSRISTNRKSPSFSLLAWQWMNWCGEDDE